MLSTLSSARGELQWTSVNGLLKRGKSICVIESFRLLAHIRARFGFGHGLWNLCRDINVELLKNLCTENSEMARPQLLDLCRSHGIFSSGIGVVSMNKDICVDKVPTAHAILGASHESFRPA